MWTTVEYVACGNPRCRACPHGPYIYEWWREKGRRRKRYCGRATQDNGGARATQDRVHPDDCIFNRRTATVDVALRILGLGRGEVGGLRRRYMELVKRHHPDAGGESKAAERIAAAYSFLKAWVKRSSL